MKSPRFSVSTRVAALMAPLPAALVLATTPLLAQQRPFDWTPVETAIGRSGTAQPGDVYRFSFPRADFDVRIGDVRLLPALALGSWVAMKMDGTMAVAMGDLVLADSEVTPVLIRLQQGGIEQMAIHHHVLHESPRVLYVHIHAHGDPVAIASAVRAVLALTGTPAARAPAAAGALDFDTAQVAAALGYTGRASGGVYQVSVPRAETIRDGDFAVPPSMGVATAINFQPTGGGRAAITGDFVLLPDEVNPVIRALQQNGIEVTSLHSHLLGEAPHVLFLHFWANDDAVRLARGLRAAIGLTNSAPPTR